MECWSKFLSYRRMASRISLITVLSLWTSMNQSDVTFGAKLWTSPLLHSGTNTFFFHDSKLKTQGFLDLLSKALKSKAPSRFICVIPKEEKLPPQFLELVTLKTSAPLFISNGKLVASLSEMSIVLAMNKESTLIDPIDWGTFKNRILKWSENWPPGLLSISEDTNAIFNERTHLLHPPRSLTKQPNNIPLKSPTIINF